MKMFPFARQRKDFPILEHQVQLSNCSQGALSIQVQNAMEEYIRTWATEGMNWPLWLERIGQSKAAFARMINASPEEIAVMSSVSDISSSIASALDFSGKRNRIVTTEMDFPSNGHVWLAQRKRGAVVRFVPQVNHMIPQHAYEPLIDNDTMLTAVPHVSFYNGFKLDIKKIAEIAHSKGSYLYVDAYQSVGSVAIDVKEMDIDFLAAGAQKYLLGIPGIAFLYVRRTLAEQMEPLNTGWFGRVQPFAFDIKQLDYASGTRRFETGTGPIINAYAVHASLEMLNGIGVPVIESYLKTLSNLGVVYAKSKGLVLNSPESPDDRASTIAVRIDNASEMEGKLKERRIIVSARNDVIRIAPHFYNTEEDVCTAIDELVRLRRQHP
jgi:selenocysteine lyase/cysteine desulfurase